MPCVTWLSGNLVADLPADPHESVRMFKRRLASLQGCPSLFRQALVAVEDCRVLLDKEAIGSKALTMVDMGPHPCSGVYKGCDDFPEVDPQEFAAALTLCDDGALLGSYSWRGAYDQEAFLGRGRWSFDDGELEFVWEDETWSGAWDYEIPPRYAQPTRVSWQPETGAIVWHVDGRGLRLRVREEVDAGLVFTTELGGGLHEHYGAA
eukprot:gnl/TRDRNA2_/TRDRNA2_69478_c0_seq1.p1 gnl/TRDRNA2_/TRDRNA2_69478_c0~~gnl/TRDRNA2_/TRDRNA2_69478_c0_seq1.p1  ORF type:complete len:207 (+),score=29.27 gnl/TRDRNA2_/TRDRNA2_69478_c0_seq1:41-661(+)